MIHLIKKQHFPNFLYNQFIPILFYFILAILLTYKKYNPLNTWLSILILYFYSYFIHIAFHNFPDMINIHINHHHNREENKNIINKIINLVLELFTDIMFFVIFYYLQKLLNVNFVPNILIFYYGFIYVTTHIVNYSIFHAAKEHISHHKSTDENKESACNYGPDFIDHLFNTKCDKNTFENYNHIIPNILISFLLTYYLYKPELF